MNEPEKHDEQLSAYLDGELSAAERQAVEDRLAREPDARALLEGLRQTSNLVAALPRASAPASLPADVTERLERAALLDDRPDLISNKMQRTVRWINRSAIAATVTPEAARSMAAP